MTATYTSVQYVAELLGETIDATTSPTTAIVTTFIERAEEEIDSITGTSYKTQTATDDYYDYDAYSVFIKEPQLAQIGRVDHIFAPIANVLKLNNYPVITITSLSVNQGSAEVPNWVSLTENTDYVLYKTEGVIAFINSGKLPTETYKGIKATYTYGHATVPRMIERLATLMAAKEVIRTKQLSSSFNSIDDISIETISISKRTGESISLLRDIQAEIELLLRKVGTINYWVV